MAPFGVIHRGRDMCGLVSAWVLSAASATMTDTNAITRTPATATPGQSIESLRATIRQDLGDERFGRYLGHGTRLESRGNAVEIIAPSTFMAQVLDRNLVPAVRRAMDAHGGEPTPIRIRVERQAAPVPGRSAAQEHTTRGPRPVTGKAGRDPRSRVRAATTHTRHKLDSFLVGESNRLAHNAALGVAEALSTAPVGPLFLHGPSGVGKTHLLEGIVQRAAERTPGLRARYITAEAFTNEFVAAIQSRSMDTFRKTWRSVRLLCIDDVHFLRGKQSTQNELLHTLDAIGARDARIVLASDEQPRKIAQLSSQLVSRFMGGAVVRIDEPDELLCRRLFLAFAAARGLTLTEDGVTALIERARQEHRRSVREIEGLLTQVSAVRRLLPSQPAGEAQTADAFCAQTNRIDSGAVRLAVRAGEGAPRRAHTPGPVRLDAIIRTVCEQMRVDTDDLFGRGRHRRVVLARGLIVSLARECTTLSFPDIARGMRRPNHSTVITARNRLQRQIAAGEQAGCGPDLAGLTIGDLLARARSAVVESSGH